ncbi:MAG TPA: hypothetical protein VKA85_03520 [Candidatus Limnocylindrales bacterium]|nr:hypothetical protein [Candidatus Limnocylindrales bacterium]
MEQRDHPDGAGEPARCAACGDQVPQERSRLLAAREDLSFAELSCPSCGSLSLAIVVAGSALGAGLPSDLASRPPVAADDVLDMHEFLSGYAGDLRALVGRSASDARERPTGSA